MAVQNTAPSLWCSKVSSFPCKGLSLQRLTEGKPDERAQRKGQAGRERKPEGRECRQSTALSRDAQLRVHRQALPAASVTSSQQLGDAPGSVATASGVVRA